MSALTPYAFVAVGLMLWKVWCLATNKVPSDMVGLSIIAIVLLFGIMGPTETLSSFSATSVVLVGTLSIFVFGLIYSGVPQWIVKHVMGNPGSYEKALTNLMVPVSLMSMFVSGAAVVAIFIHVVKIWAKNLKIAPSKLLLPLSYAASLGGLCTLIGSASNLVIADFYNSQSDTPLELFAPFLPGVCCMVIGIIATMLLKRFLPVRRAPEESFESSSDYTVELLVPTDCTHIGETVQEAQLDDVNGGHLIEIVRFDSEVISPVPKDEFILGGDHLVYSGQINSILELRQTHGLVNATHHVFSVDEVSKNRRLQMASVDSASPLIGQCMAQLDFEDRNNVVLIAVARQGERITSIPRDIVLEAGDTLLFEGDKLRPEQFIDNLDFFDSIALPQSGTKTLVSALIVLLMVVLSAFRIMPLLNSCMLAVMLMLATRCCSMEQAQRSINWKLLMVFAGSYCLGKTIEATGISAFIAHLVTTVCDTNVILALVIVCAITTCVTEFVSNIAVGASLAPVVIDIANNTGASPKAFIIALMIAASCSFATPFGGDTQLLVYGPGGYKLGDYLKVGIPMNIIMLIANVFFVYLFLL